MRAFSTSHGKKKEGEKGKKKEKMKEMIHT